MTDDPKIHHLPRPAKRTEDSPITIVESYGGCQHLHTVVDEKLALVRCHDCGEKLNPIWVLARLAQEDRMLRDRWATMRADLHFMREKRRFKCCGCGRMNNVKSSATRQQVFELAEKMKRGEEP